MKERSNICPHLIANNSTLLKTFQDCFEIKSNPNKRKSASARTSKKKNLNNNAREKGGLFFLDRYIEGVIEKVVVRFIVLSSNVESQEHGELVKDLLSIVTMFIARYNAINLKKMDGHIQMDLQLEFEDLQVRSKGSKV
ncbi:38717_t:CDS:2, partial [Gigaspora margarita]